MNYTQIGIFFLQGAVVASLILFLFRLRKYLGIGLLFACLGLFQFMQVFLSSTVYVAITRNLLVSPGSSVLFTSTLFAILLIYIKEGAGQTRRIIYALFIVNIVMSILMQSFGWNIEDSSTYNPFNVSTNLFNNNAWVLFVGTIALFLDSLLIIISYEFVSKRISHLFLRICLTMLIVVSFDSFFFSIAAFWNYDNLKHIIASGLLSKGVFAIYYSLFFFLYLKYIETKVYKSGSYSIKDVFQKLSYRQKYEVVAQDVLKASAEIQLKEIKYQTLTNMSPVGIFQTRSDGYTTYVNSRWCEISGLSFDEAIGDGWLESVHPDDKQIIKKGWDLAVTQKINSETQYRFVLNDGSIRWVLGNAVPELDIHNQIIGFVGTITDITELKLFQQEQIRLKNKAEESDRLKSAFLANMSHEIRTPMNSILGFTELLKKTDLTDSEQLEYISFIQKGGTRLLSIIDDILNISKIESGIIDTNLSETNINNHCEFVFNSLKLEAEHKKLKLSFICALPEKEVLIHTDGEKLLRILINLVKNAIKFTDKGTISFGYVKRGEELEFYVKDTGIGIPKDKLDYIFERFIQVDVFDKMARQGTGLGLAISKSYVEMLGGKIWVKSEDGSGSTFYFTLPYNIDSLK